MPVTIIKKKDKSISINSKTGELCAGGVSISNISTPTFDTGVFAGVIPYKLPVAVDIAIKPLTIWVLSYKQYTFDLSLDEKHNTTNVIEWWVVKPTVEMLYDAFHKYHWYIDLNNNNIYILYSKGTSIFNGGVYGFGELAQSKYI